MGADSLDVEAKALYLVPPAGFVAARNARRAELKSTDRELADAVGELRRASPAAWLTTALVREHPDVLDELEALAGRLRAAVDAADREALADLAEQRREALRQATLLATDVGEAEGATPNRAALDGVAATLQAAMGDAAAAAAVRSGLLLRALQGSGFDPVDLTDALAVPVAGGAEDEPPRARPKLRRVQDPDAELARARREAGEAMEDAEAEARRAGDAALRLEQQIVDADRIRTELEQELEDLQVELARTRDGLTAARRELRELESERTRAIRARDRADDAVERARERRARFE
jgi:hypothetical protein